MGLLFEREKDSAYLVELKDWPSDTWAHLDVLETNPPPLEAWFEMSGVKFMRKMQLTRDLHGEVSLLSLTRRSYPDYPSLPTC